MRQHSLMALVGMLALLLGSCGGGEETAQQSPTPSSPAASASPSVAASSASLQPSATVPFSTPLVAQQSAKEPAVPGLVQPTNADARAGQVQKGRKDPFAIIPIVPVVKVSPDQEAGSSTSVAPRPVPSLPAIPLIPLPPSVNIGLRAPSKPPAIISPKIVVRRPVVIPRRVTLIPSPRPLPLIPNFKPELPRLPEPTLAQGVEVSGVVQVGNQPEAIVKAPNEPTSRYVTVGQRLANGQVLVKRIEMNEGNPVVILEQYGIEVAKAVGEKSLTPNQQFGRPAAALPRGLGGIAVSSHPA